MKTNEKRKDWVSLAVQPTEAFEKHLLGAPPRYDCPELSLSVGPTLEELQRLFHNAKPCALRQNWLSHEEPGFTQALVRAGWRAHSLLVFAEINDLDIFNDATEADLRTWELGDTFEIFLRPSGQLSYVELHVTPQNQQLQLRYPDADAVELVRDGAEMEEFLIRDGAFRSATWVRPEQKKWFVFAEIPSSLVCEKPRQLAGSQWNFSFCRYDYTRGCSTPVISSTSRHRKPDFHRQQEWGAMHFQSQEKYS